MPNADRMMAFLRHYRDMQPEGGELSLDDYRSQLAAFLNATADGQRATVRGPRLTPTVAPNYQRGPAKAAPNYGRVPREMISGGRTYEGETFEPPRPAIHSTPSGGPGDVRRYLTGGRKRRARGVTLDRDPYRR